MIDFIFNRKKPEPEKPDFIIVNNEAFRISKIDFMYILPDERIPEEKCHYVRVAGENINLTKDQYEAIMEELNGQN